MLPVSIDQLQQAALDFPEEVKTQYRVLYAIMQPFNGVPKYPSEFLSSSFLKKRMNTSSALNKLASDIEKLELYKNDLNYAKNRPRQFALAQSTVQSIETIVQMYTENVEKYQNSLFVDYLYGNKATPPEYPEKPALIELKRDPNWVATIKEVFKQSVSQSVTTQDLHNVRCGSLNGEPCTSDRKWQLKKYQLVLNATAPDRILKNGQLIASEANWSSPYVFPGDIRSLSDNKVMLRDFKAGSRPFDVILKAEEYELKEID